MSSPPGPGAPEKAAIEAAEAVAASHLKGDQLPQLHALSQVEQTPGTAQGSQKVSEPSKSASVGVLEPPIEETPKAIFSETLGHVDFNQDGFNTNATVANDGRVNIKIDQKTRRLSELLVPALRSQLSLQLGPEVTEEPSAIIPPGLNTQGGKLPPPPLNVVIHVVGSRGDVQPFVALGKVLKETHGHRVRLATHPTFRGFVEENGLEFFSIGGDPAELMAFMVKNPGLMPGIESLRAGDVGKRRKGMYEIVQGCWRSCIEVGDGTGMRASDDNIDIRSSFDSGISMNDPSAQPFVADAIIANPPSFAHIHCAERLGIPLHLMFTMPWSPTQAFPHPLANIQSSNADASITNFVSYALVEIMTWQGLGDIINRFREDHLGLEPVSLMWAPGMASRLRVPYTYCWSPALIPKPKDWGSHITISGFFFLSLANSFTPAPELATFLAAGPPPVYIGFGSIVVDDPNAMTKLIFEAVKKTGQRALVSKGWGGFGADAIGVPDEIFMLGNVPHDWLFKHVSCVVHHGGAGTTAAGIALGKPTVIVPFFGDQPFWGAMVAKAGAGPLPVPSKHLTADNLAAAILEALKPSAQKRAQRLGLSIKSESGIEVGAQSFHEKLDLDKLRCTLAPRRAAAWRIKRTHIRLSPFAATTLGNEGLLDFNDLKLYRPMEYNIEDGPWDPISGGASALLGTLGSLAMGVADFPVEILKSLRAKSTDEPTSGASSRQISRSTTIDTRKEPAKNILYAPTAMDANQTSINTTGIQSLIKGNVEIPDIGSDSTETSEQHQLGSVHRNSTASAHTTGSDVSSSTEPSSSQRTHRSFTANQASQISLEAALGAGKGIGRIVGAGLKSPMDFTLNLARGFHNAPRLYGDESVRQPDKITGFHSGLKAAGKEFGLGFYDGISGLITQPIEGAKKEGVAGLIKGFGKGLGGVVLKPGAAIWGLPGFTFMGIYKELQKHFGSSVQNYIIAARTAQGYEDWKKSDLEERLDIVARWHEVQIELSKEKESARHNSFQGPHCLIKSKHTSFEHKKQKHDDKKKQKKLERVKASTHERRDSSRFCGRLPKSRRHPSVNIANSDHATFEEAIQRSVAATSQGDPEQDKLIERAIRASVLELKSASQEGDNEDAVQRAIQASITEASRVRKENAGRQSIDIASDDDRHEAQLKLELQRSMGIQSEAGSQATRHPLANVDFDDSGIDTEDDEHIKAAIKHSENMVTAQGMPDGDMELEKALEESRKAHDQYEEGAARARKEEETLLDHVKKLSLRESNGR